MSAAPTQIGAPADGVVARLTAATWRFLHVQLPGWVHARPGLFGAPHMASMFAWMVIAALAALFVIAFVGGMT